MIENFVVVSTADQAIKRYGLKTNACNLPIPKPSIISSGDRAWIITCKSPDTLQTMKFGYTGEYSQKQMNLLNLRTDDIEREDNEQEYDRLMRVLTKPAISGSIQNYRCAVLVDAFLVTSPENTTYLIHMQNQERPFAIAGIYSSWLNFETNLYETGFTIITAASNPMLKRIGVEHMPVILTLQNLKVWLDLKQDRRKVLPLIHTYSDDLMNGYPISSKIFSGNITSDILQPIGQKFKPDMNPKHKETSILKNP